MRQGGHMSDPRTDAAPGDIDYIAVEESAPFRELKRRQRSFIFPLAVAFLVWYFVYVLLSSFARDFMSQRAWGDITVGQIGRATGRTPVTNAQLVCRLLLEKNN